MITNLCPKINVMKMGCRDLFTSQVSSYCCLRHHDAIVSVTSQLLSHSTGCMFRGNNPSHLNAH